MGYYYRERNTSHIVLSILIALFILGTVIGLAFLNVEPLASAKNAVAGLFTTTVTHDIDRQASTLMPTTEQPSTNPGTIDAGQTPATPVTKQLPGIADTIPVPPSTPQAEPKPPARTGNPPSVPAFRKATCDQHIRVGATGS